MDLLVKLQKNPKVPLPALERKRSFRFSLRYKVALPVFLFVTLSSFVLFQSTFQFVHELVMERNETRLLSVAEVFTESLKVPLVLSNQEVLHANLEWMARRSDVVEVRVENEDGVIIGSTNPTSMELPVPISHSDFRGVQRLSPDRYGVAVGIDVGNENLGRLIILFSQMGFEEDLQRIFTERMKLAFVMWLVLMMVIAGVMWFILRPLFKLKHTVQDILSGDLQARADIHTLDEIEDLAGAFNEMVSRLARSLDNLKARTEALEESEEKYRLIVDNASDFIFALTVEGEIVFLNDGFSGCSREKIMQEGLALFRSLHSQETLERFDEALRIVQETRESVTNLSTTHIHQSNQTEIYYLTNLTPLIDHEGKVKLIQGVMRDVTELRRIEIMKESLIRDVAHELKTPTAKFEMAVNWIEKEMQNDEALRKHAPLIEILKSNTDRLMRTITSIMDLSRLESGMLQITQEDLRLNDVLVTVCRDMEPLCARKGLALESRLANEPLAVKGDRDMLYRLFVNLIGNAIKFTPKGKIVVRSYRETDHAVAEVSDTGIGLAKNDQEHVFDRFFQKTPSSSGIGVGLTICRDIAALHNAQIWVESEGLGKGCVFKVKFT